MKEEFLTIQEAADFFGVSTRTLRRWEEKGYLTAQRTFGNQRRYSKSQLTALFTVPSVPDATKTPTPGTAQNIASHNPIIASLHSSPSNAVPNVSPITEDTSEDFKSISTSEKSVHGFAMPTHPVHKHHAKQQQWVMGLAGVSAGLVLLFLSAIVISNAQGLSDGRTSFNTWLTPDGTTGSTKGVLAAEDSTPSIALQVNVPAVFGKKATFLDAFEIKNSLRVDKESNLFGGINTNNNNITAGTGTVTASNLVYSVLAGTNVTITGDPQNPTISATGGVDSVQGETGAVAFTEGTGIGLDGLEISNTGVLSLQGQTGALSFTQGSGISLSGFTIANSDPGSAQKIYGTFRVGSTDLTAGSNADTITFAAGSGITLTPNAGSKTITITSDAAGVLSGLTTNGVLYATSATTATSTAAGTNGYILKSTGTGSAPEWVAPGTVLGFVNFDFISTGTNTSADMVVGSGATMGYTGTGTINASSLQNSTWVSPGAIGSTTPNTGAFTTLTATTLNGLTVTANGSNTLTIATGKTITLNNSLALSGTDGTAFTFPAASGTLVSRDSTDTLTNKTIAAGSNTITGITNSNLSGTAGITNANLANSSITVTAGTGMSGGGAVSLGGSVTLDNAGVTSATGGTGITIDTSTGDIAITNSGVTSLAGTANQVSVSGGTGAVTLSLPQDIHTAATPTFGGLTLSSFVNNGGLLYANGSGALAQSSTLFAGTNGLGIGSNAIGNGKLVINQENATGDIFSASSSGTTRLTLSNAGNLNLAGTYYANGVAGITQGSASCVTTTNGIVTGFGTCQLGSEQWEIANGAIYTGNPSLDLILGGTSTDSAKFAVINISGGTPTATISAETGDGAAYLAGNGVLGTTNAQTLTIGSASTGNVVIDAGSGSIALSDPTTVNGGINLSLGNGYSINSVSVLNATTLGTNVVNSSLTSVSALTSGSIASGFGTISTGNNITTTATVTGGTVNSTGSLQTNGTNRIDSSGNVVNANNVTAGGVITLGGLQSCDTINTDGSGVLSCGNDADTTYSAGNDLDLTGTTFSVESTLDFVEIINLAGTGTLNGVDVIDAATESTIESAIDTLANLVSITLSGDTITDFTGTGLQMSGNSLTTTLGDSVSLTSEITGVLGIANGGTNKNLTLSNGGIIWSDADSFEVLSAAGSAGLALVSGGAGTPAWFAPTQGSVLFAGVNGALTQDNASFYFDDTNNRFGIGVNSNLLSTLDVRGTSGTRSIASFSGQTSVAGVVVDNNGLGDIFTASKSGATKFTITNSGTVAIGSFPRSVSGSTPTGTLHLWGNENSTNSIMHFGDVTDLSNAYIKESGTTDSDQLELGGREGLILATGGSGSSYGAARVTIDGSGSVRIHGLTSCNTIDTDSNGVLSCGTDEGGGSSLFTDGGAITYLTSVTDDLAIGGSTSSAPFFFDESAEQLILTNTTGGESFRVNDVASDTTPFVIDTDGDVGIGTTSPDASLDIFRPVGSDAVIGMRDGDVAHGITNYTATDRFFFIQPLSSTGGGAHIAGLSDGDISGVYVDAIIGAADPTDTTAAIRLNAHKRSGVDLAPIGASETVLQLTNNFSSVLTVLGSGNVGIGTITPESLLEIQNTEGLDAILTLDADDGDDTADTWFIESEAADNDLSFVNGTTEVLKLTSGGSLSIAGGQVFDALTAGTLGIGTTNATTLSLGRSGQSITLGGYNNCGMLTTSGTTLTCSSVPAGNTQYLRLSSGAFSLVNDTADFLFGSNASSSAKFKLSSSGTQPAASVSARTAQAALIVDNTGVGDLFAASSSGMSRFVIKQNGNVGIGTTLPTARLHVADNQATSRVKLFLENTNASSKSTAITLGVNSTIGSWELGTDYFNNNSDDLYLYGGGSGASRFYVNSSGSIAIGTNHITPLATLDVRGNSGTSPVASFSGQTSRAALIVDNTGVGDLFTASKSGATKFVIDNRGFVGLGSKEVRNPLYVVGHTTDDSVVFADSPASTNYLAFGTNRSGGGYNDIASVIGGGFGDLILNRGGGNVGIGLTDALAPLHVEGVSRLNYSTNTNAHGISTGGGILFTQWNNTTDPYAYLKIWEASSGFIFQNNGVGSSDELARITGTGSFALGTANPLGRLDVRGNSGTLAVASISGQTARAALFVDNNGVGDLFTASKSGATKFVVKNSGNVGIGLTTPEERLHVIGNVLIPNSSWFMAETAAGANATLFGIDSSDRVLLNTSASTTGIVIRSDGNVGIGVLDPGQALEIENGGIVQLHNSVVQDYGDLNFKIDADNNGTTDNFNFLDGAGNRLMTIEEAGNVGIGLDDPTDLLHLDGSLRFVNPTESDVSGNSKIFVGSRPETAADGTLDATRLTAIDNYGGDVDPYYGLIFQTGGTSDGGGMKLTDDGLIIWGAGDDDLLRIYNEDTNSVQFTISDSGNASIDGTLTIETTSDDNERLCHNGADGAALTGITIEDCTVAGEDFAEYALVKDVGAEPGDVVYTVGPDAAYPKLIAKSKTSKAYQNHSGVISTNPFIDVLGDEQYKGKPGAKPIALAGRVPVKVSTENGPIAVGDPLAASSIPGVAMKATRATYVIGFAQEAYDGSVQVSEQVLDQEAIYNSDLDDRQAYNSNPAIWPTGVGKIIAEYKPTWFDPSMSINENGNITYNGASLNQAELPEVYIAGNNPSADSHSAATFDPMAFNSQVATTSAMTDVKDQVGSMGDMLDTLTERVASLEGQLDFPSLTSHFSPLEASSAAELELDALDVKDATVSNTLAVLGRTTLSDVGITGRVNIGLLSIEGLDEDGSAAINTSAGALKLQSNGLNGIDILDGKMTIDTKGNIKTEGEITVKKVNVDTTDVASASLGEALLESGQTKVVITTKALTEDSKIFVQAQETPVMTAVKKIAPDKFEIRVRTAETTDVKLNWWIVN